MPNTHRKRSLILGASAIVALGCLGLAQQSARAQNSVAGWAERTGYPQLTSKAVGFTGRPAVLSRGMFASTEEEQKFADYYNLFLFPSVTWYDPPNRQLPKEDPAAKRDDVITKLRSDLKSCEKPAQKQVFDKLADLTVAYMTEIAKDVKYHPAARVNAMLAIGEVNSPKAVDALLATLRDPNQIDAVRVAAMSGLVRLAGLGTQSAMASPATAGPVIERMVRIVSVRIPENARADGIRWMRGQAADVLGDLRSAGSGVPEALLIMLNDKNLPIQLRSKAARALGKLNYGGNPPAATPYLTALRDFGRDALGSDQPVNQGRVRLVARDVLDGVKPFASSDLPNDQKLIDGLQKTMQSLYKGTESTLKLETLKTYIDKAKESLDSLLG